jgi:hypothetical protein
MAMSNPMPTTAATVHPSVCLSALDSVPARTAWTPNALLANQRPPHAPHGRANVNYCTATCLRRCPCTTSDVRCDPPRCAVAPADPAFIPRLRASGLLRCTMPSASLLRRRLCAFVDFIDRAGTCVCMWTLWVSGTWWFGWVWVWDDVYRAPDERSIYVDAETRIQILDTMLLLPQADKEQCAAFIVRPLPEPRSNLI